ncbi:MAG: Rieske 2Fe-2S domain-containing protein [Gemmatimonadaceae bacterium]|jgi:nitrite reductase/ring-hydroxylating ferredoxin subunit|nr:Rieske 2Fe-2S domain-containing protein [Gemmatimonadaceae bacterium]
MSHDRSAVDQSAEFVQLSRRSFVSAATISLCGLALGGCASSEGNNDGPTAPPPPPPPPADAVVVTATEVRITVARVPDLAQANGFVFVAAPRIIVGNLGSNQFRAYSAVCPHEAQNVNQVQNGLLLCPTHGSRFDLATGQVVNGPANRGLQTRTSTFDAATGVLTVRLS